MRLFLWCIIAFLFTACCNYCHGAVCATLERNNNFAACLFWRTATTGLWDLDDAGPAWQHGFCAGISSLWVCFETKDRRWRCEQVECNILCVVRRVRVSQLVCLVPPWFCWVLKSVSIRVSVSFLHIHNYIMCWRIQFYTAGNVTICKFQINCIITRTLVRID